MTYYQTKSGAKPQETMDRKVLSQKGGLYDPAEEYDSCETQSVPTFSATVL